MSRCTLASLVGVVYQRIKCILAWSTLLGNYFEKSGMIAKYIGYKLRGLSGRRDRIFRESA